MFLARLVRPCAALLALACLGVLPARAGGPITSGQVVTGTVAAPSFGDTWTFTGTSGNRVLIAAVAAPGVMNTNITLRSPAGTIVYTNSADRAEFQLTANGTWTILIEDFGLNDPGTFTLSLLNLTAGPFTNPSDLDGGAIASGEVKTGQTSPIADFDAFTFSAAAGNRVVLAAIATGGDVQYNTTLYVYPPGGGTAEALTGGDRIDLLLGATGTYTILIEDSSLDHIGNYSLSFMNLTAGPLTTAADPDGGTIGSGETKTGTIGTTPDIDAYRFTGTSGQRVVIGGLATSGALNTNLYLYPPGGGVATVVSSGDRVDYLLLTTGQWTLVVEDFGNDATGGYTLSLLNVTGGPLTTAADPDGGPIGSGEVKSGQSNLATDFDAFTFAGSAGDRVVLAAVATAGVSYNTQVYLYPPSGSAAETFTPTDRIDHVLGATGTYTILIEDAALDHTGSYSLSFINLTSGPLTLQADPDGGGIASGETKVGTIGTIPDFDGYRFTGTSGQRVVLGGLATSGALNTNMSLYPPGGGAATFVTSGDRVDYMLPTSGEWTILVEDFGTDATGGYALSLLNVTGGPLTTAADPNGGPIGSGEVKSGQSNVVTDFDAFTFGGTAGDRIVLAAIATAGASYNTSIYLYPPAGGPAETFTGADRIDHMLGATGTYTILIEDAGLDHTGSYSLSFMNLTAGPLTTAADPDGGTIASATTKSGTIGSTPDFDAYRFAGSNGNRVLVGGLATGAGLNTNLYLYPPGNGAPTVVSSGDRLDHQLNATGQWTLLVEDFGNDATGPYTLSFLNLTEGPLVAAGDVDGGAIASNEIRTGQMTVVTDFDAFTFSGTAGNRVVVAGVATEGTSFNTMVYLYPPNGAPAEAFTGGDRLDQRLAASGVYTIVIEDSNLDHTGTYSVALLNVTAGPLTSANDPDGGFITSGAVRNGATSSIADLDGYWFAGSPGDTAKISAVATSGLLNTNIYVYPPLGAAPAVITSADNVVFPVTVAGTHTILIEDFGLDHTGNYTLTLTGPLRTVDVPDGPAGPLDPLRVVFRTAFPNPSSRGATLTYSLPRPLPVRLTIYDVFGARVRTLADETREAGVHTATWDGRNERGDRTHSGLYYAVLRAGDETLTTKLVRVE